VPRLPGSLLRKQSLLNHSDPIGKIIVFYTVPFRKRRTGKGDARLNASKAEFFDTQVHEEWACSPYDGSEIQRLSRMIEFAGVRRGMRVLEPGCGTGRLTELLADAVGPWGEVVAVDMSLGMADACCQRVNARPNVSVVPAALEDFPLESGHFDVALCHNVFPHFDDKPGAARKLAEALDRSGSLVIYHFLNSTQSNDPRRKVHPIVLNDLLPGRETIQEILRWAGLTIESFSDDHAGYFVKAVSHAGQVSAI
jgi:ubiquinone/menaquinone biosynthesis C-methylase UbiE